MIYQVNFKVIVFASVILVAGRAAAAVSPTEEQLGRCLSASAEPQAVIYDNFLQGKPVRLLLHKLWHSPKTPSLDIPLTLFTGLTAGRLDQMKAQCNHWPGRISTALYVPVSAKAGAAEQDIDTSVLQEAAAGVEALLKELNSNATSCTLDVLLLYELVTDEAMMDILPINQLRNYAMLQARTELVSMVDVDLLPSKTLADYLRIPEKLKEIQQLCQEKTVIVVPAFSTAVQWQDEATGHRLAEAMAAIPTKRALKDMYTEGLVYQFHGTYFRWGHDCTNYQRWFAAHTESFYSVRKCWSPSYEPWFIINRNLNPPYNGVFRGFGWNKQSHVAEVYHKGFGFQVIPHGFLVHRQHDASGSRKRYNKPTKQELRSGTQIRNVTTRFQQKMMKELRSKNYTPALDDGYTGCREQLSWWSF